MLYKEITKKHAEAKIYGNIGGWFANGDTFTSLLEDLEAKGFTELTLRIHCYGGSVFEGTAMYNAMQRSPLTINIVIEGVAASMACFILPAIENVSIADNAFGMIHRPSSYGDGDADSHLSTAKLLRDMENIFIKQLTARTGMAADEIKKKWFDGSDHWLNATEMVQYGLAKKIVPAAAKNIRDLDLDAITNMGMEGMYAKYAACLNPEINTNENQKKMNKQLLIAAFQLEGVTAESDDAAVLAALQAKFSGLESRIQTMETEANSKRDASIKTVLDTAQEAGKIMANATQSVEQVRATYENIGKTNGVDVLTAVLANTGTKTPIAQMIVQEGKGGENTPNAGAKDWDWYQANDLKGLQKMEKENPADFKALYFAKYGGFPA